MIPTSAYITSRFKVKTILMTSLGLFFLASIIAYFAPNIEALIFARVLQAVGSGVLLPITQIVIFKVIPEEKWQIFMGLFGFIIGIAPALAPTLGGMIIDAFSWREIFLVFAAFTFVIILIGIFAVKFELETSDYPLDFTSLILCIVACEALCLVSLILQNMEQVFYMYLHLLLLVLFVYLYLSNVNIILNIHYLT